MKTEFEAVIVRHDRDVEIHVEASVTADPNGRPSWEIIGMFRSGDAAELTADEDSDMVEKAIRKFDNAYSTAFPTDPDGYDYKSRPFPGFDRTSYTVIEPLPKLHGRPFDEVTLAYIHALRPSYLRVIPHGSGAQLDARNWRVTVWLDAAGSVKEIRQEVEVGLPVGVEDGWALKHALQFGQDSPQVKWHEGATNVHIDCVNDTITKRGPDGERVPFPKTNKQKAAIQSRDELGKLAYEKYRAGMESMTAEKYPPWEGAAHEDQIAWRDAAEVIAERIYLAYA